MSLRRCRSAAVPAGCGLVTAGAGGRIRRQHDRRRGRRSRARPGQIRPPARSGMPRPPSEAAPASALPSNRGIHRAARSRLSAICPSVAPWRSRSSFEPHHGEVPASRHDVRKPSHTGRQAVREPAHRDLSTLRARLTAIPARPRNAYLQLGGYRAWTNFGDSTERKAAAFGLRRGLLRRSVCGDRGPGAGQVVAERDRERLRVAVVQGAEPGALVVDAGEPDRVPLQVKTPSAAGSRAAPRRRW